MTGIAQENGKNVQLVKVYIRQRPFTKHELETRRPSVVQDLTPREIFLKNGVVEKKYTFDRVFASSTPQSEVYEVVVAPSIEFVLSGYTCTVFAYGQTGTGKTYTMTGPEVAPSIDYVNDPSTGIIPRAAQHIFTRLQELNIEHTVTVSFIEIYNEEVRDLLVKDSPPLRIYDDPDNKGATCVKGLRECKASDMSYVYDLLNMGATEKQMASTNLNRNSSRSHTIFTLVVNTREVTSDSEEIIKTGKLHLIDLAGSENIGRSGATEMRAREAGTINKSLLTLGKVIKALALKMQHIPYRESKLTRILQDSLGGKSKTCMIATFSPIVDAFDETVSTLDYAHFARSVANCPTVNINKNHTNVLKVSQDEVTNLRQELNAARAGEGFYMNSASYEKINFDIRTKNERVLYLVQEIRELEEHIREKKQARDELNESFERASSNLESLTKELEEESEKEATYKYVKEYVNGSLLKVKEIANTLLDVCQSSTKHEDIYHKKYETQLNTSLHNANIARNTSAAAITALKEIQHSFDSFLKNHEQYLSDAKTSAQCVKDNQLDNFDKLDKLTKDIQSQIDSYNPSVDSLFRDKTYSTSKVYDTSKANFIRIYKTQLEKLDEIRTSLSRAEKLVFENKTVVQAQAKQAQNSIQEAWFKDKEYCTNVDNLLDELYKSLEQKYNTIQEQIINTQKFVEMHKQFLEVATSRLENTQRNLESSEHIVNTIDKMIKVRDETSVKYLTNIMEAITRFNECLKPLKSQEFSVGNVISIIEDSERICQDESISCEKQTQEYFTGFFNKLQEEVDYLNNQLENTFSRWAEKCSSVHDDLENSGLKHSKIIQDNIETFLAAQKTHYADVKQFIQNSSETLESLGKNIENRVHDGDTPVKPVYEYPKKLERVIPEEVLKEQCKRNILEKDSPVHYTVKCEK